MPKVPEAYRQCVFYLYRSREAAEKGENFGGTGFFVMVASETHPGLPYFHGVSNWHLAVKEGFSVIRVNTHKGPPDVFEMDPSEWIFEPSGPDIAITPPVFLDIKVHKVRAIVEDAMFISQATVAAKEIAAGEDVFMAGRFVDLDRGSTNEPALRFGNISVMPTPIKHDTGYLGDTYCIDLHSRTGFSGSPVFAYRTTGSDLGDLVRLDLTKNFDGLLGIHFGQFREDWELESMDGKAIPTKDEALYLDSKNVRIKGLSGMTCVAPAWEISRILNAPEAKNMRKALDKQYSGPAAPTPESESPKKDHPETDSSDDKRDGVLKTMLDTPPNPRK